MKKLVKTLLLPLAGLLFSTMFSSCYFNSAGHLFDRASYRAAADMADLQPGDIVYMDGDACYVELPRYHAGMPVQTQISAGEQSMSVARFDRVGRGETEMISIPRDYALYLTGQASEPKRPSFMRRVSTDSSLIKGGSLHTPVARVPEEARCYFNYTSPAAAGWYTLGALDWLCVDFPITCVENSLMLCGGLFVLLLD